MVKQNFFIISSLKYELNDPKHFFDACYYTHTKQNHRFKAYIKFDIKSDLTALNMLRKAYFAIMNKKQDFFKIVTMRFKSSLLKCMRQY